MTPLARLDRGALDATWSPTERLLRLSFRDVPAPDPGTLADLRARLRDWVGHAEPYSVLADLSGLGAAHVRLRVFFGEFFRLGAKPRIAVHGLTSTQAFFLGLVRDPFPWDVRTFATEREALGWLAAGPIVGDER